jgi:hypothetical protein
MGQDRRPSGTGSNMHLAEYDAGLLPTRLQHSLNLHVYLHKILEAKAKLPLKQATQAYMVVRRRGSHIV